MSQFYAWLGKNWRQRPRDRLAWTLDFHGLPLRPDHLVMD